MTINIKKPLLDLLSTKNALLFDLDGTLVDSSCCHEDAFNQAMELYAPHLLPSFVYEEVKGLRTDDVFRNLRVEDEDLVKRLTAEKQASYRKRIADGEVKAFPYVKELLMALHENGYRLALVTSASRGSATSILNNLELVRFFEKVITGEDVTKAKPAPDGYLTCVEQMQVRKEAAIVVEDALSGIEAGRSAGLDVIAVNNSELARMDEFIGTITDLHAALLTTMRS
ncbi:MAG TPA: HAD family hydrolase [Oculatellaceae cyanobacterium]